MYNILYYQNNDWEILATDFEKEDVAKEWAKTYKSVFECRTKVVKQGEEVIK